MSARPRPSDALLAPARAIARAGTWLGGGLLLLAVALIVAEVLLRKLAAVSIQGIDELTGYCMAIGITWALALALLERGHVRIDSLYGLLPVRLAALLDLAALALFAAFMGLVTFHGWGVVANSFQLSSRDATMFRVPLMVPQGLWAAGLTMFLAVAALLWLRAFAALVRGDLDGSRRLIGSRSASEDVGEELASFRTRSTSAAGPAP